jgi:hypothetical protein
MTEPNYYHKISPNQIINNKIKVNKLKALNQKILNNFNYFDYSEPNSVNKINYSEFPTYILSQRKKEFIPKNQNNSNISSNHKLTYVITANESSNFDAINNSTQNKPINLSHYLSNKSKNTTNYEKESKDYEKKYLECFQSYKEEKEKRAFSSKLQKHRENLNNIVKLLNEANSMTKSKNKKNNALELYKTYSNNEMKENINQNGYNIKGKIKTFDKTKNESDEKIFINNLEEDLNYFSEKPTNYIKVKEGRFDTYTYTSDFKSPKIVKKRESDDILYKKLKHKLINKKNNNHKNLTGDNLIHNLKKNDINPEPNNNNNINNELSLENEDENTNKIKKLRNEFKKISNNYINVSKQIDSLKSDEISYEDIVKNNNQPNDIINYKYKYNNDTENEKVFILMKLNMKKNEIIINKLEEQNKKYKKNFKNLENKIKQNKILLHENNSLKAELKETNINNQKLNEQIVEYHSKLSNINTFNQKIQEINKGLINENSKLKKNIEFNKNKDEEYKNNYDEIISQQEELVKKMEEEKNNSIKKIEEEYNYINNENNNLKIILNDSKSKNKVLEERYNEINDKYNKLENELKILIIKIMNCKI